MLQTLQLIAIVWFKCCGILRIPGIDKPTAPKPWRQRPCYGPLGGGVAIASWHLHLCRSRRFRQCPLLSLNSVVWRFGVGVRLGPTPSSKYLQMNFLNVQFEFAQELGHCCLRD